MPLRAFGKTGQKVSLAGLGTAQWSAGGMPVKRAGEIVRRAVDLGVNYIDTAPSYGGSHAERCLPFANRKGTGVVAMKVFCSGRLPADGIVGAEECLRYTYGLSIGTCIVGCTTVEQIELAAHVARNLKPLDDTDRAALLAKTKKHSPSLEWYKRKS